MQDLLAGWAEEIRSQLDASGRSQKWLADRCGVHPSTIHRVLSAELDPNNELKWKIAGALGVRMDVLWGWPKIIPPMPAEVAS